MSCIWGRTRPWWSISLLNNDYCSLEQSIDWLNRTQKKNWISFCKKTIFLWPKLEHHGGLMFMSPWAAAGVHITAFYRGAGRWWRWQLGELVTGFRSQVAFTQTSAQNRVCQAAQYLPCNMKPCCSIHAFSALRVELTSAEDSSLKSLIQIYSRYIYTHCCSFPV